MKIAVTGGSGFIGKHLVHNFIKQGHEVTTFSSFSSDIPGVDEIIGDVRDLDALEKAFEGKDAVFHLAALTSVVDSFSEPGEYEEVNVIGTINAINAAAKNKVKKFIFTSSAAVYGNTDKLPVKESDELHTLSPYALTKLAGERYTTMLCEQAGIDWVILRPFNIYGPGQEKSKVMGVIPLFLYNEDIIVYGDNTRDFIHIDDVVRAYMLALEKAHSIVLNVGSGIEKPIKDIASIVSKLKGVEPEFRPARPGEIERSVADISRLEKLGFRPEVGIEDGIMDLWERKEKK